MGRWGDGRIKPKVNPSIRPHGFVIILRSVRNPYIATTENSIIVRKASKDATTMGQVE
jgi:hypothetical protein